ncbi:pyrroline-5-carboxylate reductase [Dendrosporobacter sp. 1207_IL3150]|uniref:pyrroline-5-carboxylate reductase n=1 Tax=Dendrosporobacter sp. 1207_IL3150 TaxID=3084054 RepID=UPI002FDB0CC5
MLKSKKIGFIGGGAIAEAIIGGIIKSGLLSAQQIYVTDIVSGRLDYLNKTYSVLTVRDYDSLINEVDILFLTVKPQVINAVIDQLSGRISSKIIIVSVVAGLTLQKIQESFSKNAIIRVMPNTPVAVGAGISAIALGKFATDYDSEIVSKIFSSVGNVVTVAEEMMDGVTGLSGSGPGYAFVIIDALADAGVRVGLPRQTALVLAAQTLLGAAKMVLETGEHPAKLRDMVTSPGGTTITGIHVLEQKGLRNALIDAVVAATNRSQEMGK